MGNFYENVFIVRPDLSQNQVEILTQNYSNLISSNNNGKLEKVEFCGIRNLAYRIRKHKKGFYTLINFISSPDVVKEIERQMKINEDILRFLTVRIEGFDSNPSPLMQQTKNIKEDNRSRSYELDYNNDETIEDSV